jgi:hypothetical protein
MGHMSKPLRPIDEYVAAVEARYGGKKSNRTIVAELARKERASERALYKEAAHITAALFEQWDREKHAALSEDEEKTISFEPQLMMYPDGRKQFSCTMHIAHYDLALLYTKTKREWVVFKEKYQYKAASLAELKQAIAPAYELALSYAHQGFQPRMWSVRTVTPEIHFPGYCPSPIPEYVTSIKKSYSEPFLHPIDREYVEQHLVMTKPWCPVPDEPRYMLIAYELQNNERVYDISTALYAFRPLLGLKQEKLLSEGYAIQKLSLYDLAWLGITPFARELTRWHTYETYYLS